MDIATQSVRVSMLVFVTFAFAAIWSADYSDASALSIRPQTPLHQRPKTGPELPPYDRPDIQWNTSHGDANRIADLGPEIPLPEGITTGNYLIVDQYGRTGTRIVTKADTDIAAVKGMAGSRDHYTSFRGMTRWHFIRIVPTGLDRMAIVPESASGVQ